MHSSWKNCTVDTQIHPLPCSVINILLFWVCHISANLSIPELEVFNQGKFLFALLYLFYILTLKFKNLISVPYNL
jgi:hypothetical protein